MSEDIFFYNNKVLLEKNRRLGKTTIKHMYAQLFIGEFFRTYGDNCTLRTLQCDPVLEAQINGGWHTDLLLNWNFNSKGFTEIVEVQSDYYWNISFKTAEEGAKIVNVLLKEGLINRTKAEDYLKHYLVRIKKHQIKNGKIDRYIGHIAFKKNTDLSGQIIGDWEINNETDLERKIRNAVAPPYDKKKKHDRFCFDYMSFAVPWKDVGKFVQDISKINNGVKMGCLYAYDDTILTQFDEQTKELSKIIDRNRGKLKRKNQLKYVAAETEYRRLEEEICESYRKKNLKTFMGALFVEMNSPETLMPKITISKIKPTSKV